jgi:Tol biopolymer transport system component
MTNTFLSLVSIVIISSADQKKESPGPEQFLVQEDGLAFIGPDGAERERLVPWATNGVLSPDGRWLACVEYEADTNRCKLVIRARGRMEEPIRLPLVWDAPGNGSQLVWAADSKRLLIAENKADNNGSLEYTYRVYELDKKKLTELKLPKGYWPTGWSGDGKRFLTDYRTDNSVRIAWLNADGTGKPEFLTPEIQSASNARLSADNKQILFMAGPKTVKSKEDHPRLYVMDLATKERTPINQTGAVFGYCWSAKGDRLAFTWQPDLDKPAEVPERKTLLLTCDRDGGNRKLITTRKYEVPPNSSGRDSLVIHFEVLDWR